jgi:hypothetical protein
MSSLHIYTSMFKSIMACGVEIGGNFFTASTRNFCMRDLDADAIGWACMNMQATRERACQLGKVLLLKMRAANFSKPASSTT